MTDQKASIGRIVLFKSQNLSDMGNGATEVPAIITRVWGDAMVNLLVFRDGTDPLTKTSVGREDAHPGSSYSWRWPPRV